MKSLTIETVSYTITTCYNFTNGYRMMNYFEYIILLVQNYALIVIVLMYRKQLNQKFLMYAGIYALVASLFAMSILPKGILTLLIVSTLNLNILNFLSKIIIKFFSPARCPCLPFPRRFNSWKFTEPKIHHRFHRSPGLYRLSQTPPESTRLCLIP